MIIDIDQLHETIEKETLWKYLPRASGRTLAMMVQAVQSADLLREEYSTIVVVSETPNGCGARLSLAEDVAKSLGIDYVKTRPEQIIEIGKCRIKFVCRINLRRYLRGQYVHNVFVDHYTKTLSYEDINFIKTRLV